MEVIQFPLDREYLVLSSAIYPEGIAKIRRVALALVQHDYDSLTPAQDVMSRCDCRDSLIFMTAARDFVLKDEGDFLLFMSAGIGRSGENAGRTINVGVFLRRRSSLNSMVDMVRTITEAKCSYLSKFGITGTASDATAVGVSRGEWEEFLGPSTPVGRKVASSVVRTLSSLLEHSHS